MSAINHHAGKKYVFGIPLYTFQAVDVVGPIDLLYSTSRAMMLEMEPTGYVPQGLSDQAIDVEFVYVAPTMEPVKLATGITLTPTATFDNCPKLTCLLLGGSGPDFFNHIPDSYIKFFHEKAQEVEFLFTTCTGGIVASKAGLLEGKKATTNWEFLDAAMKECPGTEWRKERWVIDGKLWTAGGAFAGVDMFEHWLEGRRSELLKEIGRRALDYQPRGLDGENLRD